MTATRRFDSMRRFKTLSSCCESACDHSRSEVDFPGTTAQSYSLREIRRRVFLKSFAAPPRIFKPARFESQGRICRPGAVGMLATLTQAMIGFVPHSSMRTVVLCRNFSSAAFVSQTLRKQERYEPVCREPKRWE